MGNILTFCEVTDNQLRVSSKAAISISRDLASHHGGDVILLLIGKGTTNAQQDACNYGNQVIVVDDPNLETYTAETYAPIIEAIAKKNNVNSIVATATSVGKDVMPRIAIKMQSGLASDISAVVDKDQFKRPVLAGNAYATIQVSSPIMCVTVRQSEVDPAQPLPSPTSDIVNESAGTLSPIDASVLRIENSVSERPDLNEATIIVSGGRGMKNAENFSHIEKLCDLLGAAMGASRAATDAGFVPSDLQIGQTGKAVAPNLYIAIAISGAIQHLAGMKNSKFIVAINKDAEAPIFQIADYGLVATWEEALPLLMEEITKLKNTHN